MSDMSTTSTHQVCANCGHPILRVVAWTDWPYWAHEESPGEPPRACRDVVLPDE